MGGLLFMRQDIVCLRVILYTHSLFKQQQNTPISYNSMSKTLQDYRNIVKILKIQYQKLKTQNQLIAKELGQANPHAQTSFTKKIASLKKQQSIMASNTLVFLELADKCQLLGITPEMIFRIADKNRQKKIQLTVLKQTMDNLALGLDGGTTTRICSFLNAKKQGTVEYDDYMATINAYQIGTERYPQTGKSYTQNALAKFSEAVGGRPVEEIFNEISSGKNKPFTIEELREYSAKHAKMMEDTELIAVFMALNIDESNEIKKTSFVNEISRIQTSSGISNMTLKKNSDEEIIYQPKKSTVASPSSSPAKDPKRPASKDEVKEPSRAAVKPPKDPKTVFDKGDRQKQRQRQRARDDDFEQREEQGVQASVIKTPKQTSSEIEKVRNDLASQALTVDILFDKMLDLAQTKIEAKSIPFDLMFEVAKSVPKGKKIKRSLLLSVFKTIDKEEKGSLCSFSLLRFWLKARDRNDSLKVLFKILRREILMRKAKDAVDYFKSKNVKMDGTFDDIQFKKLFQDFLLPTSEMEELRSLLRQFHGKDVAQKINECSVKVEGKEKEFEKPNYKTLGDLEKLIKPLIPQKTECRFMKHDNEAKRTEFWNTIFTNEWACWNYCLQQTKPLTTFWKDPDFGTQTEIDSLCAKPSLSELFPTDVCWINHDKILTMNDKKDSQTLFGKEVASSDAVQGDLGDCWFISSMSIVAQYPSLLLGEKLEHIKEGNIDDCIKGISPKMFAGFNKYGIYVFKFYKGGEPCFVVVDDKIPTRENQPSATMARTPEMLMDVQWVSLAEKAYAKLHNTYSNLISGDIADGLKDLTNWIPMRETIYKGKGQNDPKLEINKNELWKKLEDYKKRKMLMGCSIMALDKNENTPQNKGKDEVERGGLMRAHAYSISDIFKIDNPDAQGDDDREFKLMRIRNPHGLNESKMDWGELDMNERNYNPDEDLLRKHMNKINEYYKQELTKAKKNHEEGVEMYEAKEDGVFLMSYDQWFKHYSTIFYGINLDSSWGCSYIKDVWSEKFPGYAESPKTEADYKTFCDKNLQYRMELSEQADIILSLQQKDFRLYRGEQYPYKNFWISIKWMAFEVKDGTERLLTYASKDELLKIAGGLERKREVSCMRRFKKGSYIIIPACKTIDKIKDKFLPEFKLEVFYNCDEGRIKLRKAGDQKVKFEVREGQRVEKRDKAVALVREIQNLKFV